MLALFPPHRYTSGAASEWPVPRALHTISLLGSRLLVLAGSGPLGPLGDAHLLESNAVQRGVQLQAQHLAAQAALARSQGSCAALDAQLACCRREATQKQQHLQVCDLARTMLEACPHSTVHQQDDYHAVSNQ